MVLISLFYGVLKMSKIILLSIIELLRYRKYCFYAIGTYLIFSERIKDQLLSITKFDIQHLLLTLNPMPHLCAGGSWHCPHSPVTQVASRDLQLLDTGQSRVSWRDPQEGPPWTVRTRTCLPGSGWKHRGLNMER